jgi:hypothetical protein
LRKRLASATSVAGVFLKLSVRYEIVVMKTHVMPKAAVRDSEIFGTHREVESRGEL